MNRQPILITGGTGFIGSHVARALLDRGDEVCLLDIRDLSAEANFILGKYVKRVSVELASIDNWPRLMEVVQQRQPRSIVHIGNGRRIRGSFFRASLAKENPPNLN